MASRRVSGLAKQGRVPSAEGREMPGRGQGGRGAERLVAGSVAAAPAASVAGEAISPARRAAFQVLLEVGERRGHSDELLHATGPKAALEGLSELDRNLATALVLGVLRWQLALDGRLQALFSRPDTVVPEPVMVALRLGAFQLLHLDRIPAHAALSESVALARAAGQEHATGMVNAVLRRLSQVPAVGSAKIYERPAEMAQRLAHPEWLVARWVRRYGPVTARRICEADQQEPGAAVWFAAGGMAGGAAAGELPVMDDGSRLVAELTALAAPEVPAGERRLRVWDACAAPGGKTAVLATRLPEAEVLATDASPRRLRLMEQRLGRLAASAGGEGTVRCVVADALALAALEGEFDLVLCDVPCSGTGTLGRNPEIRLRLEAADLSRQAARQRALLSAAMQRVAVGGRLVYSTCSLEPEECEAVVTSVLAAAGEGWRQVPVGALLERLGAVQGLVQRPEKVEREGQLRTLPGVHPGDGFYAAVLERC